MAHSPWGSPKSHLVCYRNMANWLPILLRVFIFGEITIVRSPRRGAAWRRVEVGDEKCWEMLGDAENYGDFVDDFVVDFRIFY